VRLKPCQFAVVSWGLTYDKDGVIGAPPVVAVGQDVFLRLTVVGLEPVQGRVQLAGKSDVLNAKTMTPAGWPSRSFAVEPNEVPAWTRVSPPATVTWQYNHLPEKGDFLIRFTIKDVLADRTITYDVPLKVIDPLEDGP
jgi:hypothetical protein